MPKSVSGVHLTRLTAGGDKAPNAEGKAKIMVGVCKGAPIIPPNDILGMTVTEGIEDALSVYQGTGLGIWAAGSAVFASALAKLIPPPKFQSGNANWSHGNEQDHASYGGGADTFRTWVNVMPADVELPVRLLSPSL